MGKRRRRIQGVIKCDNTESGIDGCVERGRVEGLGRAWRSGFRSLTEDEKKLSGAGRWLSK